MSLLRHISHVLVLIFKYRFWEIFCRPPSVVSILSEDTCSASSSTRDREDGVRSRSQVLRSATTSATYDRAHGVGYFDLTSNDFDVNQIQPPSPPVTHTDASGAALPSLLIPQSNTSPLPSSLAVTTDFEVIRTEAVSSHNAISNTQSLTWIINHSTLPTLT